MTNADLAAIINSDEIQAVIRPAKSAPKKAATRRVVDKLNPAAASARRFAKKLADKTSKLAQVVKKQKAAKAEKAKKHASGKKSFKALLNSYKSTAPVAADE
jgi:hypothetical protein